MIGQKSNEAFTFFFFFLTNSEQKHNRNWKGDFWACFVLERMPIKP